MSAELFNKIRQLLLALKTVRSEEFILANKMGQILLALEKKYEGSPEERREMSKELARSMLGLDYEQYLRYVKFAELVLDFPMIIELEGLSFSETADNADNIRAYLDGNDTDKTFMKKESKYA